MKKISNFFSKHKATGPLTRKRRDRERMTHTQHDPSIDEPTLQNNYPEENADVKASVFKIEKLSKYLQAKDEPLEIKVTNINGEYHVRLLDKGKLHSEMACKEKQDISYCTHEMLRWYDKLGGVSPMAEASRHRQKLQTPIGKIRKIK